MSKINEELIKILQKAMDVAEKTGDFAIEQAPLLLQEFYNWHIVSNIFITIILLSALIFSQIKKKQVIANDWHDGDYMESPLPISLDACSIFLMSISVYKIYNVIFIWVAPKVYLIEYFLGTGN